jgi:hypothetical protein
VQDDAQTADLRMQLIIVPAVADAGQKVELLLHFLSRVSQIVPSMKTRITFITSPSVCCEAALRKLP